MEIIIGIIVAIVVWVAMTLKQAKGSTANAIAFFENARANGTTPNLHEPPENKWHACFILDHYMFKENLTDDEIHDIFYIISAAPTIFSLNEQRKYADFMDKAIQKSMLSPGGLSED